MLEKENFVNQIVRVGKKAAINEQETVPLSLLNSHQQDDQAGDESSDTSKAVASIQETAKQNQTDQKLLLHQQGKALKSQNSQQGSPTDEEINCMLRNAGFLEEKGWSKILGGAFMEASVVSFTVMCCILATLYGALAAGYVASVISTIEKRFEIGSFYSGLIVASVEMGGASSAIFVSYFGSARHIPGWIGLGAALIGVGALVSTLPHVMAPAYTVTGGLNSTAAAESVCRVKQPLSLPPFSSALLSGAPHLSTNNCDQMSGPFYYVLILILAQFLIGIGGSPLYTLGTTYIDNHVSRMKAPSYIAFIYACGVFGPIVGFALGALMLQYYVDLLSFDTTALNLTPSNPKWVGAWWGGFVFLGALLLLVSVPFYGFPKVLVNELKILARQDRQKFFSLMDVFGSSQESRPLTNQEEGTSSTNDTDVAIRRGSTYGKNMKDIPSAMFKILKNPIYLVTSLGICCEVSVVSGFVYFLPKYLEREFGASKSMANLLTGGIAIPGAVVGILMGGYCLRHCQLTSKGAIQLTLALNSISLAGFGLFFALGCGNVKIAGVTVPYDNHSYYKDLNNYIFVDSYNLTSSCNKDCSCDNNNLDLVCGVDEVLFFSPCHAGCMQLASSNFIEQNYTNCSCAYDTSLPYLEEFEGGGVPLKRGNSWVRSASGGACQHVCGTLVPFMVMLFIMTFVVTGTQMPLLMVTIRSVGEQEKALALGLQCVMLRLFAYIPAPIIYGWQIDKACIIFNKMCGVFGNCLVYDLVQLRYKFVGISFAYKFFAAMFYLSIWILMWLRHEKYLKDGEGSTSKRISLMVVDESNALFVSLQPAQIAGEEGGIPTSNLSDEERNLSKEDQSYGASGHTKISRVANAIYDDQNEVSDHENTIETILDCTDALNGLDNNGENIKQDDDDSLNFKKQFSTFPLIDADDLPENDQVLESIRTINRVTNSPLPFFNHQSPPPIPSPDSFSTFNDSQSLKIISKNN